MKNKIATLLLTLLIVLIQLPAFSQDSAKQGAVKQVNKTSSAADVQYGKKIQQQTLSNKGVNQLNVVPAGNFKKKAVVKKSKFKSKK